MGRLFFSAAFSALLLGAGLLISGCATAPVGVAPARVALGLDKLPFSYEPLGVHNGCFVEAVNFYDHYFRKLKDDETQWAQVLEWGNEEGDLKVRSGHAVTVFTLRDRLWYYDVNFGVRSLDLAVDRRSDLTDVGPKIFASYPQFRPILARYRYDFSQQPAKKPVDFLFYHANPDVRDATRVASELGRIRPVSVAEFDLKPGDKTQVSAAAVFTFGRRVCVYFPRQGTFEAPRFVGAVDDLRFINQIVRHFYPEAGNLRWQSGGYLLFPKTEK